MKKIIFFLPQMLGRGVEKSFLTLIKKLPKEEYDISVYFVEKRGEFLPLIPKWVHVGEIPMDDTVRFDASHDVSTKNKIIRSLKKGRFAEAYGIFYRKAIKKDPLGGFTCFFEKLPKLEGEYDLAVCYHLHNPFLLRYVVKAVNAKRRIAWIHNDFETTGFPIARYENDLLLYDRIFGASKKIVEEFKQRVPRLADKIYCFTNYVDTDELFTKAGNSAPEEYKKMIGKKIICTVGALTDQKGIDIAIDATKKIKEHGIENFKWFVIGEGNLHEELQKHIEEQGVFEQFFLCGHKDNPYPYFKFCDIYVQPSRHEGYGIALAEAIIFNKPCISTDFAGAREQIEPDVTGEIVVCDSEKIAEALMTFLNDEEKCQKYSLNMQKANMVKSSSDDVQLTLLTELL